MIIKLQERQPVGGIMRERPNFEEHRAADGGRAYFLGFNP
ncbi:hypothetical protein Desti_3403 [Desulfomonile tiedjei DSM 6799]|uniref:Uncharacterized protein n=1 Tax=Desulfomonile tiedjei (strain ATCC 49306 / DSM 6799 / DCB-1) TaxID=706587 RepID=I4C916_DESTA|nr:hypothetical protein Desti_3403 [Desulfomonile tiedjei DSM 6799]